MSEARDPPFEFKVVLADGLWHVAFVRDEGPHLWQIIASFHSQDRAEDYADTEWHMARDFPEDPHRHEDTKVPAVAPEPPPPSAIKPENFRPVAHIAPPTPVGHEPKPVEIKVNDTDRSPLTRGPIVKAPAPELRGGNNHIDAEIDASIVDMLRKGWSIRTIAAAVGVAENTVSLRSAALIDAGDLKPRAEMTGMEITKRGGIRAAVSSEEIERRLQACLAAIRDIAKEGGKLSYPSVAERAGMSTGSVAPSLLELKKRGLIKILTRGEIGSEELRTKGGIRLIEPPKAEAPTPSAATAPQPRAVPPTAAPSKPVIDEDAAIAAHIASKGVTRVETTKPDVDAVMNECRAAGDIIVPVDDRFKQFTLNDTTLLSRESLVARANRSRVRAGKPLWDAGRVTWSRPEPLPGNDWKAQRTKAFSGAHA